MITGSIRDYDGRRLIIEAFYTDDLRLMKQQVKKCEIRLEDGRSISTDQRKKIYATFRDISIYTGFTCDEVKSLMKYDFVAKTGAQYFSLSDVDMSTAKEFLEFLIEFCIENDIPCSDNLLTRSPDVARYIYCCLLNKKCCITGRKAELHHVDAIGMGNDRKDIIHRGMRVLPLTRKMHSKAHTIGQKEFDNEYHVFGIKLDDVLCGIWKVKG